MISQNYGFHISGLKTLNITTPTESENSPSIQLASFSLISDISISQDFHLQEVSLLSWLRVVANFAWCQTEDLEKKMVYINSQNALMK